MYDSRNDTMQHRFKVIEAIEIVVDKLGARELHHDDSKLEPPEKEVFDEFTPKLSATTFGSDEYKANTAAMRPAIEHHQSVNRHHPEHFENGIAGMNLVDVVEMMCDWWAASKRHADGDIFRSIEICQKRFRFSDEMKSIFINTAKLLEGTES